MLLLRSIKTVKGWPVCQRPMPLSCHPPKTCNSGIVQERLPWSEWKVVHAVNGDIAANVEDARPFVARETIHILRYARFAPSHRAVVDRMRPCIARRCPQCGYRQAAVKQRFRLKNGIT